MKNKILILFGLLLGLSACGTPDPEAERAKHLKPKGNAVNVVFNDKKTAQAVVGFRAATVITKLGTKELQGSGSSQNGGVDSVEADCKIASKGYSAEFKTPAKVNLPSFGRSTPPLKMTCTYEGKSKTEKYDAVNLSSGSRQGSALAVGVLLCPICGVATAVANGGDKTGDAYGFTQINMNMK